MSTFACEFCQAVFTSKGNLNQHHKRAKACLSQRGVEENSAFKCGLCKRMFVSDQYLHAHLSSCARHMTVEQTRTVHQELISLQQLIDERNNRIDEQNDHIRQLEMRVDELNGKFVELAAKPRTTLTNHHHNTIHCTLNLNDTTRLEQVLSNMTADALAYGQVGVARYLAKNYLTDPNGKMMYRCVDTARQNFVYHNEHGVAEKDVKCSKLTSALVQGNLQSIAIEKGEELWTKDDGRIDSERMTIFHDKVLEVASMGNDNTKFASELTKLAV